MRKNIQHIQIPKNEIQRSNYKSTFETAEGILIKDTYQLSDIDNVEQIGFGAGFAPHLRGTSTMMYLNSPWKICQKINFSIDKQFNSSDQNIIANNKDFLISLDLFSSPNEAVNKLNVNSVDDMKLLFDQISLDEIVVSMEMNHVLLPTLAFYIVAAKEQGIDEKELSGIFQKNITKEFLVRKTSNDFSGIKSKIFTDILDYTNKKMPKFNSILISGSHLHKVCATTDIELAYTFSEALDNIRKGFDNNLKIDDLAPRLSFSFSVGMNHFMEIAKLRAARLVWTKLISRLHPKSDKSIILRTHCQTSVSSLDNESFFNNVTRTTIEAAAAVFGGTESLQTNALDKSDTSSNNLSTRIARNIQLYLQEETKICKTIDPWSGSYYVECLTSEIVEKTWALIEEIESFGGMTKAVEAGIAEKRINEAIVGKQTEINLYKNKIDSYFEKESLQKAVDIKHSEQYESSKKAILTRDRVKVQNCLNALRIGSKLGNGNLLALAIEAATYRASFDEILDAL